MRHLIYGTILGILSTSMMSSIASATDSGAAQNRMFTPRFGASKNPYQQDPVEKVYRIRIPLMMQAYHEVAATKSDGKIRPAKVPAKPVSHMLRARIDKPNDFYVGDWKIQTIPVRWDKETNMYQVKVDVYRRLGEQGQVEETLGSISLTGQLVKQGDRLYTIQGSANKRFVDAYGQPLLELQVGSPKAQSNLPVANKGAESKTR